MEELINLLRTQFEGYKTLIVIRRKRSFFFSFFSFLKPHETILDDNKQFMNRRQVAVERAITC